MNKQRFNSIVKDYHNISEDDRNRLQELAQNYPYSQIIHTLVAKANSDAKTSAAGYTLGVAAMYATDRATLKNIITDKSLVDKKAVKKEELKPVVSKPLVPSQPEKTTYEGVMTTPVEETKESTITEEPKTTAKRKFTVDESFVKETFHGEADLLRESIWEDLKALKESKSNYLEQFDLLESESKKQIKTKTTTSEKTIPVPKLTAENIESEVKEATKKKTTVKVKTKSASKAKPKATKKSEPKKTTKKKTSATKAKSPSAKKTATKSSPQISEGTTPNTKGPARIEKKDQMTIIENFISKEPSITSKTSKKAITNQEDLSESSTAFGEDLISENLALILVSQGKKEKAIDIYKKLIWKFPQKKAYFASQIEELKK